jgi:hypothetical protein
MKKRVLIADPLHVHKRNFASLFEYFRLADCETILCDLPKDLLTAFGHYAERGEVMAFAGPLRSLSADQLFVMRAGGATLFSIARLELMARVATEPDWIGLDCYGQDDRALFDRLFERNHEALIENLAAARYWCQRWHAIIRNTPPVSIAVLFSGCLIYARAFAEIMHRRQGALYICESFFTGCDYYLEARHSPLPNQSLLRAPGLYSFLAAPLHGPARRGARVALVNRLGERNNKNVRQPAPANQRLFPAETKVVLILGQVLNDFSLLNTGRAGFHSIAFYRSCIERLLRDTSASVIFKAHPWERKKLGDGRARTYDTLVSHFGENQPRVQFVEDYPIDDLFLEADFAVGINTQSLLEAAFAGLKPIQIGDAFYGNKGFTHDVHEVQEIVDIVNRQRASSLSVREYAAFETFMIKALQSWLVPEQAGEGIPRLISLLGPVPKKPASKVAAGQAKAAVVQKAAVAASAVNVAAAAVTARIDGVEAESSRAIRKWQKLRRTPHAFFRDSRLPLLRALARWF